MSAGKSSWTLTSSEHPSLLQSSLRIAWEDALKVALQGLGFSGRLNTASIERVNLTIRHAIAALARHTWATAQQSPHLLAHLEWWRAYYHFVRPMLRCEWHWYRHKCEGANVWRNGTGSIRQLWQREEPTDGGPCRKCSVIPCLRCHTSPCERE